MVSNIVRTQLYVNLLLIPIYPERLSQMKHPSPLHEYTRGVLVTVQC